MTVPPRFTIVVFVKGNPPLFNVPPVFTVIVRVVVVLTVNVKVPPLFTATAPPPPNPFKLEIVNVPAFTFVPPDQELLPVRIVVPPALALLTRPAPLIVPEWVIEPIVFAKSKNAPEAILIGVPVGTVFPLNLASLTVPLEIVMLPFIKLAPVNEKIPVPTFVKELLVAATPKLPEKIVEVFNAPIDQATVPAPTDNIAPLPEREPMLYVKAPFPAMFPGELTVYAVVALELLTNWNISRPASIVPVKADQLPVTNNVFGAVVVTMKAPAPVRVPECVNPFVAEK